MSDCNPLARQDGPTWTTSSGDFWLSVAILGCQISPMNKCFFPRGGRSSHSLRVFAGTDRIPVYVRSNLSNPSPPSLLAPLLARSTGFFFAPAVNYFSLAFDLHSPSARPNRRAEVPLPAFRCLAGLLIARWLGRFLICNQPNCPIGGQRRSFLPLIRCGKSLIRNSAYRYGTNPNQLHG